DAPRRRAVASVGVDLALADRLHVNLMRLNAWVGQVGGGGIEHENGTLLVASRSELQFLNAALRERGAADAAELMSRAKGFFTARGRGFLVYCWPGDPELERAAGEAGLTVVLDSYPEMVCRAPVAALPGDVRPVETLADAESYWTICEGAYAS